MSSVSVVSVRWVMNVFWWVVCIVVMVRPIPWIHVISVRGISIEGVTDMRVIVGITMAIVSHVIAIGVVTLGIPVAVIRGVSWVVRVLGQVLVTAVGGRLVVAASAPWRAIPRIITTVRIISVYAIIGRHTVAPPATVWRILIAIKPCGGARAVW